MEQEDTNILEIKVSIINKHIMSQKQLKLWTHGSFLCHHRNSNIKKESFGNLNKIQKIYIYVWGDKSSDPSTVVSKQDSWVVPHPLL